MNKEKSLLESLKVLDKRLTILEDAVIDLLKLLKEQKGKWAL